MQSRCWSKTRTAGHGHVGDPGYETGQLLYGAHAWGYAVCGLSKVWNVGDGHPIDGGAPAVARALEPCL